MNPFLTKKNIFLLGFIIILVVIGIIYNYSNNNQNKGQYTTVKFGYLPIVWNLPLYAAIEKGYFDKEKIIPEMVQFQSPNQIIDAIISGQIDFTAPGGPLGIPAIVDYKNPGKMKVYAISGEEAADASGVDIIIPIDSQITSLSQLKNKKLGIPAGTIQWRTIAREILAKNGLDMDKDLTIVELAPTIQVQAISSGQIDALLALEPIPTVAVSKGVAKILIKAPDKLIADPMWVGAGVVGTDFVKSNPDSAKKVVSILNKSIKEVNVDFNSNRQYLPKYTSLPAEIVSRVPAINYRTCEQIDQNNLESIQKFLDLFTKYKVVDGIIDINKLLYCK
jgi:NitT/TauT family transport system substrate-binding protein